MLHALKAEAIERPMADKVKRLMEQVYTGQIFRLSWKTPDKVAGWLINYLNEFNSGMEDGVLEWIIIIVMKEPEWLKAKKANAKAIAPERFHQRG